VLWYTISFTPPPPILSGSGSGVGVHMYIGMFCQMELGGGGGGHIFLPYQPHSVNSPACWVYLCFCAPGEFTQFVSVYSMNTLQ
jgi:hypothetical protein